MSIILFEAIQRVQRLGRGLLRYISNELSGFDSSPLLSFEKDTKFYLIQSKGGFAHELATAVGNLCQQSIYLHLLYSANLRLLFFLY
jgi:hypothetical protein